MLNPHYHKKFDKDIKRQIKRGKNIEGLKEIIIELINEQPLQEKYKDHKLIGNFVGRRECHIEPDWLLIYRIEGDDIIFERTGSHSDLFK